MMRLIAGARGRVRPLSVRTRRTDDTQQAAALAGLGAGSLFDRGFMFLYACIKKAACEKHSRRWLSAATPLFAAGSSRQGEVPGVAQKSQQFRQCDSSFFLVVTRRLSPMTSAKSSMRARRSVSLPVRKRSRGVSARCEVCGAWERCAGAVAEEGRVATNE